MHSRARTHAPSAQSADRRSGRERERAHGAPRATSLPPAPRRTEVGAARGSVGHASRAHRARRRPARGRAAALAAAGRARAQPRQRAAHGWTGVLAPRCGRTRACRPLSRAALTRAGGDRCAAAAAGASCAGGAAALARPRALATCVRGACAASGVASAPAPSARSAHSLGLAPSHGARPRARHGRGCATARGARPCPALRRVAAACGALALGSGPAAAGVGSAAARGVRGVGGRAWRRGMATRGAHRVAPLAARHSRPGSDGRRLSQSVGRRRQRQPACCARAPQWARSLQAPQRAAAGGAWPLQHARSPRQFTTARGCHGGSDGQRGAGTHPYRRRAAAAAAAGLAGARL